uniref:Protein kinase domain-containing protein n=1 Tax=Eucampia antarctica TaxID=49252 RepID=A0A7S2W826_9STRA
MSSAKMDRSTMMRRISCSNSELKASIKNLSSFTNEVNNNCIKFRAGFSIGTGPSAASSKEELERLVHSLSASLMDTKSSYGSKGEDRYKVTDVSFEPDGCDWNATVVPENDGETFTIELDCNEVIEDTDPTEKISQTKEYKRHYSVCMTRSGVKFDPAKAKKIFDLIGLDVRKSIVRLDFPKFPEGLKSVTFREIYQLNARLKSGSFATVCRGTHRATGRKVAIKCVLRKDLPPSDDAAIIDEVAILASLKHRYICPIIDFFEEFQCYFIVMELMAGGDLFDKIGKKKSYNEKNARDLSVQILEAVAFCHRKNVAHCDMKPKNLLLQGDDDTSIKLADFGFATRVYAPNSLSKQCGTPFFVAPEILLRNPYDEKSDMWSVGVIIYLLLSGTLPFVGRSQRELFRAIVKGDYEMEEENWDGVSEDGVNLVKSLLVTDSSKRLTAKQALNSDWLKQDDGKLMMIDLMNASTRLKTFNARMKLRTAMIAINWLTKSTIWKAQLAKKIGVDDSGEKDVTKKLAESKIDE